MATHWNGNVFVIPLDEDRFQLATVLPVGITVASQIAVYAAAGPSFPVPIPEGEIVTDVAAWLERKRAEGFSFQRTNLP